MQAAYYYWIFRDIFTWNDNDLLQSLYCLHNIPQEKLGPVVGNIYCNVAFGSEFCDKIFQNEKVDKDTGKRMEDKYLFSSRGVKNFNKIDCLYLVGIHFLKFLRRTCAHDYVLPV